MIDGAILDVGGDPKSSYHQQLRGDHEITFANFSRKVQADIYFDAQELWPVPSQSFDAVIMNNLLEHVFDHAAVIREAFKALRPGGCLVGSVPFLYYVHGSPDDYWRYTHSTLSRLFSGAGFIRVQIEELGTGAFSAAFDAIGGILPSPLFQMGRCLATGTDRTFTLLKPGNALGPSKFPLGYFFIAAKPAL